MAWLGEMVPIAGREDWMMNVRGLLSPYVVWTTTLRGVAAAEGSIVRFAFTTVVLVDEITETVVPVAGVTTTARPAWMNLLPVIVRVTGAVALPEVGVIVEITGFALFTTNVRAPLVPRGETIFTSRAPSGASGAIVNVAVADVALRTLTDTPVMPEPETVAAVAPRKFIPVRWIVWGFVSALPDVGTMVVRTGATRLIVKVRGLLVPIGVVTVILRGPVTAFTSTVNVAVIDVVLLKR